MSEDQRSSVLWAVAAGALAGALAGYVLKTSRGRRALDDVIVMLEDFSTGCARLSQACARAQLTATDGWYAVIDALAPKSMKTH